MPTTKDKRRFGGVARVYGENSAILLSRSHVVVAGLGGVGSWAAEALVRSGVGHLTIIDGDRAELSNTNRQLHALEGNYGRMKVDLMRERMLAIAPGAAVDALPVFIAPENAEALLPHKADFLIDCVDDLPAKVLLCAFAREHGIPIAVSGGAAGRSDPGRVVEDDVARIQGDPLIGVLRSRLRKSAGFPRGPARAGEKPRPFGIRAVASSEPQRLPDEANRSAAGLGPDAGIGLGASVVVTGTFGLRLAGIAIRSILGRVSA